MGSEDKFGDWSDQIWLLSQAFVFLILTIMYGVCAHLLTLENYKSAQQLPIQNANLVNLTIMVCFGSRSAIDFAQVISFHGSWRDECCTLSFTSDTDLKVWPVILYFIWEFIPTILTMVFVANATGTFSIVQLLCFRTSGGMIGGRTPPGRYVYDHRLNTYVERGQHHTSISSDMESLRHDSDASILSALDRQSPFSEMLLQDRSDSPRMMDSHFIPVDG